MEHLLTSNGHLLLPSSLKAAKNATPVQIHALPDNGATGYATMSPVVVFSRNGKSAYQARKKPKAGERAFSSPNLASDDEHLRRCTSCGHCFCEIWLFLQHIKLKQVAHAPKISSACYITLMSSMNLRYVGSARYFSIRRLFNDLHRPIINMALILMSSSFSGVIVF